MPKISDKGGAMWFIDLYEKTNFAVTLAIAELIVCWRLPLRLNKWIGIPVFVIATVASTFIPFELLWNNVFNAWALILKHVVVFAVSLAGVYICYKVDIWVVMFASVMAFCVQNIAAYTSFFFQYLIGNNDWANMSVLIAVCAVAYVLLFFLFTNKMQKGATLELNNKLQIFISLAILLINILLTTFGFSFLRNYSNTALSLIVALISIVFSVVVLILEKQMLLLKENEKEIEIINHMLQKQAEQYEQAKGSIELINVKCHDLRHKMHSVPGVSADEFEDVSAAISIYDSVLKTGNEALDVLFAEKNLACGPEGIRLTCFVDGGNLDYMKPGDIYALFGNALDNAIEAVKKLPEEYRAISISQEKRGGLICIKVQNYCNGPVIFADGLPVTQKDKNFHGFGMKSMRLILRKYGGELAAGFKDGVFTLKMLIIVGGGGG